ncbi:arylsulfatase [Tichowtungia aerotolerans]|uniref:Sulfatase-like hydrolase/transferase n=1 Tax=Tichowtungia aerotolerans TaxID=2697043 RepID=A0A6P1ME98_9BACT|nr:arylsulfatase [Tichowtungia aerotolerans]QHI70378.1 sulfatase-like hydrolase/transferase [Tichowtungia aerotolerans]
MANLIVGIFRKWTGYALVLFGGIQCAANQVSPNIVVILADDLGYSDLGCYGAEIHTPNLDSLAKDGVLFTHFYNAARCCPSRASILTGLYPHQAGVGSMTGREASNEAVPAYQGSLRQDCVTLGEVMKLNGYYTISSGKWHVGEESPEMMPFSRGFERSFFTPGGAGSYYSVGWANGALKPFTLDGVESLPWDGFYDTDAVFDFTIRFLRERPADSPFFAYVTPRAPHWPLHAKPEDIAKYKGVYDCGWDAIRARRYEKQVELGLVSKHWKPAPRSDGDGVVPAWETLSPDRQREMAAKMEVYAAQVDCLDQNVGKLVAFLKEEKQFRNTLILFLSDNGACAEPANKPFGQDWKNGNGGPVGSASSFESYGRCWAEVSNTPFRFWKWKAHEGGISTPLIASWPQGISAKGSVCRQPGHLVDVMATCLDLCDGTYPQTYKGNEIQPMEGISFSPVFQGGQREDPEVLAWEHFANRGILCGKWKLVSQTDDNWTHAKPGPWELYNLDDDRTESSDLAKQMPEKVAELVSRYDEWAKRVGVVGNTADWRQQ